MGCLLKANGLYARTSVGAVLLAAGAGSHLGGRPKALLELGGVPLVMRQLIALSGAGVDEVALVLDHDADAVEAAVRAFPITLVRQPSPDGDDASCVSLGLQALSPRLDAVIVTPADLPMIDAQDIVALISAFKKRGDAALVLPRGAAALPGRPLIFDSALREAWLTGTADPASACWREANMAQVRWLDVEHRRFGTTLDTPEDLERFAIATGHRLVWPASFEAQAVP